MTEYDLQSYETVVSVRKATHDNGDETVVVAVEALDKFLVVAVDVDETDEVIDAELVDVTQTSEEADSKAEMWAKNNPKGIAGDSTLASLFG